MKVAGVLSLRNGHGLEYPYPPVVLNLSQLCDEVIVGVDPEFPYDALTIQGMGLPNVRIVESSWDMTFRGHGFEIARQMDLLVEQANADWVVVLQADELLHNDDFEKLRATMEQHLDTNVNGLSTERLYFWRDLHTVRADWNAPMVRIFKPGTRSFLAEGTSKDGMYSGAVSPGQELELACKIYHYSRVSADPIQISRRVRNLDGFFHTEDSLIPVEELPEYDFIPREHDNFSFSSPPLPVKGVFEQFEDTHPYGIAEWLDG